MKKILVYERQEGESKQAFEGFRIYRDLGAERSLQAVAQKLSKSTTLMKRWSAKHDWVNRANEFDREMDLKALIQQEKERREMAKRHAQQSMMFQGKVLERMQKLKPEELSTNDLIRWFTEAVKIERLSRGVATEINEVNVDADVKQSQNEDLEERLDKYEKLYEEMENRRKGTHG